MTPIETFVQALHELDRHAADMVSQEQDSHEDTCLWCTASILLARQEHFGKQLQVVKLQDVR